MAAKEDDAAPAPRLDPHDYRYFHGDGSPRHAHLQQDAAAALEVFEELERKAQASAPAKD